ncbi:hypothetical protein [Fimbriiglobus ruber]|uniref:hypothetical protein n=1 Tax=Fimbriiglobus ruber TaxID=1908690 RepID=UPI00117AFB9E|nr:hypothetical protein [Fimbriiglobus ruber]
MLLTKRTIRLSLIGFGIVLLLVVLYCVSTTEYAISLAFRQVRGTKYEASVIRWWLANHGTPLEKSLVRRDIYAGQSAEEITALYGPFRVETVGRYQLLTALRPPGTLSFEGYQLTVLDGRVKAATEWSCTWKIDFFDILTSEENAELRAALMEEYEQMRLRWATPRMAIAGGLAYTDPRKFPQSAPPTHPDP